MTGCISEKKIDPTVLFQGRQGQFFVSHKRPGLNIWKKSLKRPVLSFFSNSRSLEQPGLMYDREFRLILTLDFDCLFSRSVV